MLVKVYNPEIVLRQLDDLAKMCNIKMNIAGHKDFKEPIVFNWCLSKRTCNLMCSIANLRDSEIVSFVDILMALREYPDNVALENELHEMFGADISDEVLRYARNPVFPKKYYYKEGNNIKPVYIYDDELKNFKESTSLEIFSLTNDEIKVLKNKGVLIDSCI